MFDVDSNFIGKSIFVDAWRRDEARADANMLQKGDIKQAVIELDKWSKMNAKLPFSRKSLTDILKYLCIELSLKISKIYRIKDNPTGLLGLLFITVRHLKQQLIETDLNNLNITSHIGSFELGANISEFYNLRLLKMEKLIKWGNIN